LFYSGRHVFGFSACGYPDCYVIFLAQRFDLAQVEAADSSAVSMLLGWLRNAQRHQAKLTFVNVPENLRSLAHLYGVADALPLNK
jgi:ABC-type transporter Mla MlaB component